LTVQRPRDLFFLRPPLVVAGLVAASLLLWFAGPLLAIGRLAPLAGEPARWVAIAVLCLVAAGAAALRMQRSARRNQRLMQGLAAPGAQEVAVLGERFAQAVALLRRSRVGGRRALLAALLGRPYVYELPWYVIIGAPGAGKTTALVHSGLEFPLAAQLGQTALRGIGGTRNCDWWFASEAVLIDTAGRYTTQDSDREADRAAWLGFLGLLKRYRPRRSLNGVLLTLSVSDLLGADAPRRAAHARELRTRIDELQTNLGIRLPVYVLVTKTDLLAGFMEFFADFDKDERAQVWGVTFPYEADAAREPSRNPALARVASDFAALEKRLNECLIDRLHAEHDRERRAALYAFPQQWRLLHETLLDFLQLTFASEPGATQPLLRGAYFTSATQEGTPMDRALGGLARALGLAHRVLPAARPSGKTFFVTRLLRDLVFAEAGLAGTDLRWQRRRAALQWSAVGLGVCALAGAALLTWDAYGDNRASISAISARLPAIEREAAAAQNTTDLAGLLPTLDALQSLADDTRSATPAPLDLALDLGLDRSRMLAAASQDAYLRLLKDAFLPRIAARLEQRLRAAGQEHVEVIYETLRAYLMLFAGKNFDRTALRASLGSDWDATLSTTLSADHRAALRRHLDRLLDTGEVGAPSLADAQLVADARRVVAGVPLAQRAYARLKQLDVGVAEAVEFSVESAGGSAARRVFARASGQPLSRGVPALYSRAVYQQTFRARMREVLQQFSREQGWVLGTAGGDAVLPPGLAGDIEQLYLADYARLWQGFVDDLRLAAPAKLADSAELARVLSRPDSPLVAVLRGVVREAAVGGDTRFDELRRYLDGQPSPAEGTQALLGKLASYLTALDDAAQRKSAPPTSDVMRELAVAAQHAPQPVARLLAQLAGSASSQTFALLREPLNAQLASEIAPACVRVAARYPLRRGASDEAARDEFARVFAADGLLDAFFQRKLLPFVDSAAHSGDALQQFQRAQAIRDAFFRDSGHKLGMQMEIKLLDMDAGINEFSLEVDGQPLRFRRDTKGAQTLQWPGPGDTGRVLLQLSPPVGSGGAGYLFQGPWALLRLLDRVRIEPGASADRLQLSFDVEGRKARFELRGAAPLNPLLRQEMEQFQCPKRL